METRGRGREARSILDETPSSNPIPTVTPSTPALQPPSTRSRTRLRARATRPSWPVEAVAPSTVQQTPVFRTRSIRASAARRAAAAAAQAASSFDATRQHLPSSSSAVPSPLPASSSSARPPLTRKRTRSASRRDSGHASASGQASSSGHPQVRSASLSRAVAAAAVSGSFTARPLKRPRRASNGRKYPRTSPHFPGRERAAASVGASRSATRDMDPVNDAGEIQDEQSAQRRAADGPNSLGSGRAGTTLQGLLRRLGADLSDIFPGNVGTSHSRLQQLRSAISSPDSDEHQIDALSELCEFLSVGTEESLVSFSVNLFVSPLVNLLRTGANIEVKIYSARALTHMMEALPSSSSSIANHGAAEPLCQNLLSIEYIDLAEQSLSALHKLSVEYPQQIVVANGFQAVLSFIDFFSLGVQRVAAATACNLCRLPRADAMDVISGVLPTMMRLLDSEDQRIRESAVLGFARLADSFRNSSAKLEALCGDDGTLIEKVLGLIVPSSPPALTPQSYASALRLLAILSRGNVTLGMRILSTKSLIRKLNSSLCSSSTLHSVDCLVLADSLLPDFPELGGTQSSSARTRRRRTVGSMSSFSAIDTKRRLDLERDVEPLHFFGQTLFATLMKFYASSADSNARRLTLSIMSKYIFMAPESVLMDAVVGLECSATISQKSSAIRFCPFVAALLGENGSRSETMFGLAMADSALQKLPSLREFFVREGVVHEIVRLATFDEDMQGGGEDRTGEAIQSRSLRSDATVSVESQGEGASMTRSDDTHQSSSLGRMELIWGAVAALQRGTLQRGSRGDTVPVPRYVPSRTLDAGVPDIQSMPALVPEAARSILRTHLGAQEDGTVNECVFKNTMLGSLTKVCTLLKDTMSSRDETKGVQALSRFIELLIAEERLTVFEISKSGIMESLAEYLTTSDSKLRLTRIVSLVQCLNKDGGRGAFSSLVDLALGVLSSEEKLAMRTNESSAGTVSASVNSGLRQLAQPFKLKLRKAVAVPGSGNLRDYSHHVVLIEPLATMASIQEFLWPRVRASDRGDGAIPLVNPRRRDGQARDSQAGQGASARDQGDEMGTTASGQGNNDRALDDIDEDRYAENTMFDMEEDMNGDEEVVDEDDDAHNSQPSEAEISSGEEDVIEHGVGDGTAQEADAVDSFDVDHMSTSLPPFELDHDTLGQAPSRVRRPQNGSNPKATGSTGSGSHQASDPAATFRSYAAALAANMPRSFDRISVPSEDGNGSAQRNGSEHADRAVVAKVPPAPKLSFVLNGRAVPHDCSILSAVIRSSAEDRGIGTRLWSDVHTLIYSKAEVRVSAYGIAAPSKSRAGTDKVQECSNTDGAGPVRRSQRLQESREKGRTQVGKKCLAVDTETPRHMLRNVAVSNGVTPVPRKAVMPDLPVSIASVVEVLRLLHWLYENMKDGHLRREVALSMPDGPRGDLDVQFYSHKLSAKIIRQLSDPVALCGGVIPNWCFSLSRDASFLLPFETRRILFQSTSLGVARALHLLQTRVDMSGVSAPSHRASRGHRENETRIGRIQRQKVRLHRNRILESAIKVMSMYGAHTTVLEVEYFDEAGTGLGPTLEFYTLASREIQRVDLGLWRCDATKVPKRKSPEKRTFSARTKKAETPSGGAVASMKRRNRRRAPIAATTTAGNVVEDSPAYVIPTGSGLYPACLPIVASDSRKEASAKSTALFAFVGRLLGKAMIDGRLVDLRFSRAFSQLLLAYCRVFYEKLKNENVDDRSFSCNRDGGGRERPPLPELDSTDREHVWNIFTCAIPAMQQLEYVDPQLASSLQTIIQMVRGDQGEAVESLYLTFVLPGDDEIELVQNGKSTEVTGKNAEEFVQRVVYHVLFGGVQEQAEALLQGLGEILDVTSLLAFKFDELDLLICGPSFEMWTIDFLVQATRCDHGYSHESPAVLHFLSILSDMEQHDQQRFIMFATGSPALPLGGLKNLHPRLTIVRRTPEAGRSPDECLPTVMTCTNYFKLPDYSSFEIARKQVMYAVREGQGSFHLS